MKADFKIEGMKELQKSLKKLGAVPQKHVTAAARKGTRVPLQKAKEDAPYLTGALSEGIIMVGERAREKGKKVYRIVFDRKMNDVFQKKGKTYLAKWSTGSKSYQQRKENDPDPNKTKVTGYYPVSQEYGFYTKSGRYIPGLYFVRDALKDTKPTIERTMIETMKKKIDAEIAKGGLK